MLVMIRVADSLVEVC